MINSIIILLAASITILSPFLAMAQELPSSDDEYSIHSASAYKPPKDIKQPRRTGPSGGR